MLMLSLNETIDQLAAMGSSEHWYGHVLRMDDGYVLRRTLEFWGEMSMEEREVKKDMEDVDGGKKHEDGLRREGSLCGSFDCWHLIMTRLRWIRPLSIIWDTTGFKTLVLYFTALCTFITKQINC